MMVMDDCGRMFSLGVSDFHVVLHRLAGRVTSRVGLIHRVRLEMRATIVNVHDFSIAWTIIVWQSIVPITSTAVAITVVSAIAVVITIAVVCAIVVIGAIIVIGIAIVVLTLLTSSISSKVRMASVMMVNHWSGYDSALLVDNLSRVRMMLVMVSDS